ncbi:MAG: Eco57I restriction-modification methylase domain-containing protein [Dysgonomonas sp.]
MSTANILQQTYNRTNWNTFLHNIFSNSYEAMINPFQENINNGIAKSASRLGEIKLDSGETIAIYDIELQNSVNISQNKVAIRNLLKQSWKYYDGAFIASYKTNETDWRFSFLSETKEWTTDGNYEKVATQAKRYTYLLGENQSCQTATERFDWLTKKEKTLSNITEAFSVETLTKQFYRELFGWYEWATSEQAGVTFPNNVATAEDDREQIDTKIIRLITRLMFVWFIKQSDLIPEKIFESEALRNILKDFDPLSKTSGSYYNAIIQNLFFATLNRAVIDEDGNQRGFAKAIGKPDVKTLYRYAELFNIPEDKVINLFAEVPFLNGGLFECLDKTKNIDGVEKAYNYDGFSRNNATFPDGRYRNRAFVPNILFFEPEKGLLSILKRYNFTIEENTPQEQQVALDPELLGKVFENLLGAYNPETKETARNQSGSFYTPREIVDYMVDEALIAYLGGTDIIRALFQEENLPKELHDNKKDRELICTKLREVRILDPACGSGAFPMGILNRIVNILQKLSGQNDENSLYNEKLQIIENCIFGVDIQNIATQISKLRFFISLICHCRKDTDKPNFGIPTLPNLETKFVSANTLIGIKQQDAGMLDLNDEKLKQMRDRLQDIRHDHFKAKSSNEKVSLRKKDEKLRSEIEKYILSQTEEPNYDRIAKLEKEIESLQKELKPYLQPNMVDDTSQYQQTSLFGNDDTQTLFQKDANEPKRKEFTGRIKIIEEQISKEKNKQKLPEFENAIGQLAAWNPYDQNSVSLFFDPEWMFGIKDGFDIVIGNPPYIPLENNGGALSKLYKPCGYNFLEKQNKGDIYCLFYERGWQLLKTNGRLCYITSNKWMRAGYGESIRKFFVECTNPEKLIDFAGVKVFESATVDTNILLLAKSENQHNTICAVADKNVKNGFNNLSVFVQQAQIICGFTSSNSWVVLSPIEQRIKEKIEGIGTPLKDWDIQINYGIKTGLNDAFIISSSKRQEILNNCTDENERKKTDALIRPILRGRDIKRYSYEWADLWLLYIPWHFPLQFDSSIIGASGKAEKIFQEEYPTVYNYLLQYKPQLSARNKAETGIRYEWYALQRWGANYWEDFLKPKIVFQEMVQESSFAYDNNMNFFCLDTGRIITGGNLKYLVAILNSSLFFFAIKHFYGGGALGENGVRMKHTFFEKFPCIIPNDKTQNILESYVDLIISQNQHGYIEKINQKIYELYSLSSEEIKCIDRTVHNILL